MDENVMEDLMNIPDDNIGNIDDVDMLNEGKYLNRKNAEYIGKNLAGGAAFGAMTTLAARGAMAPRERKPEPTNSTPQNESYDSDMEDFLAESITTEDMVEEAGGKALTRMGRIAKATMGGMKGKNIFTPGNVAAAAGAGAFAAGEIGGEIGMNYALDRFESSYATETADVSPQEAKENAKEIEKMRNQGSNTNDDQPMEGDYSPILSQAEESFVAACALADLTTVDERADLVTSLEDMQAMGEMMGIAMERTIVRLDKKARFNHLIKANNLNLARKDNHPKYRKLLTLWKMERAIEGDLDRIYRTKSTAMAKQQIKNYAANGIKRLPKPNSSTVVGKKKVSSKIAQRAKASADRFFSKSRTNVGR